MKTVSDLVSIENVSSKLTWKIFSTKFFVFQEMPPPHNFGLGKCSLSTTSTLCPLSANRYPRVEPAGPAPTIMTSYSFPFDFGITCGIAWALMLMGLLMFAFQKEPEKQALIEKASIKAQFKLAFSFFLKDLNFRKLIFSRIWANTAYMAMPFYVILSIKKLKILITNLLWFSLWVFLSQSAS